MLTRNRVNLRGYDDNPFPSPQKSFEKMRKMLYLCSALVENGLPFSFAGFQIPTNLGGLFCFCARPDWVNNQKKNCFSWKSSLDTQRHCWLRATSSSRNRSETSLFEFGITCPHKWKFNQWLFFKVVIWLRAGGVCWVAFIRLFGFGQLTLASFDNVKVLVEFGPNYLFFAFNVMASALLLAYELH